MTVFDLFLLNALATEWRETINSSPPMRKHACGMISFNMKEDDNFWLHTGKLDLVDRAVHQTSLQRPVHKPRSLCTVRDEFYR